MKKALLHFYSNNNLGDDLFVKILTDRYKNKFSSVVVLPNKTFAEVDNLKLYSNKILTVALKGIGRVFGRRNIALRYLAKRNDIFVYVGGSIFIDNGNLPTWRKEEVFYSQLGIPYYILGSNFGPSRSSEFLGIVRKIVSGAQDVCFRDKASYELFKDIPSTRVATDIAFTLDVGKTKSIQKHAKMVVISVIDAYSRFNKTVADRYEQEIINFSEQLVKRGYKVTLMSFCRYEGDEAAILRILDKMSEKLKKMISSYIYTGDIEEALGVLSESEVIVASRFHAAVLGLVFGKKVLPIVYSDKTINILRDLNFDGPIFDIREIDKFNGRKFDISNLRVNNIDKQKKLAEKQFQELDKILEKRK